MLRNPAYKGTACFNKTKTAKRQRITRPIRLRGGFASRDSAHHERPREDWIEIPVPPIVTEETFALASERLKSNKDHAPRRTITPSVVQGLVSCRKCSYGLYRTSTRTSARMIHYYRCLGSDAWRRLGGPVCDSKPIRQDLLDEVVWREILKLLESPRLIQEELERRLAAARTASPVKRREEHLQRELARVRKSMERLMTAYQEELMSLDDLRRRMPELRKRDQAISAELNALESQLADRAGYLRLAETMTSFLARLRETAKALEVAERQRIVRLLVKEILVDDDTIVIRHSIPAPESTDGSGTSRSKGHQPLGDASYLLRKGSNHPTLRRPRSSRHDAAVLHLHRRLQPALDVEQYPRAIRMTPDRLEHQLPIDAVEVSFDVDVEHPVVSPAALTGLAHRIDRRSAGPVAIRVGVEHRLQTRLQIATGDLLGDAVSDRWNAQRTRTAIRFRYIDPPHRRRKVAP